MDERKHRFSDTMTPGACDTIERMRAQGLYVFESFSRNRLDGQNTGDFFIQGEKNVRFRKNWLRLHGPLVLRQSEMSELD